MAGIGMFPLGSGPFGTGTPLESPGEPTAVFEDPSTGEQRSGRHIDYAARDYTLNTEGMPDGMGTVEQLVLLAFLGANFGALDRISDDFPKRVRTLVEQRMAHITGPGLAAIRGVDVERIGASRVSVHVRWVDVSTTTERSTKVL